MNVLPLHYSFNVKANNVQVRSFLDILFFIISASLNTHVFKEADIIYI